MKWYRHGDPNYVRPVAVYNTSTYKVWTAMKQRCNNPRHNAYSEYGGRGISYSPSWEFFDNFLSDMGLRPKGLTLDRIDNNGNYTKENCRWASRKTQSNNRRNNVIIEYSGKRLTMRQWENLLGLPADTLYNRIKKAGWTIDRAITTPLRIYKNTRATL